MKKSGQYAIILVIGLIAISLVIVFLNQNNSEDYPTKTFSKNNITFDYPESWQDYTEKANIKSATEIETKTNKTYSTTYHTSEFLAVVGDPNTGEPGIKDNNTPMPTTTFIVTKIEDNVKSTDDFHPEGFMSEMLIQSWLNNTKRVNFQNYINIQVTTRNFTISGLNAHEFTYTGFHRGTKNNEYTQIVAFEKRDISKKKETVYTIMCTAMGSDIRKSKMMFDRIIDSFKIN